MATYSKLTLSGSTDGRQIKVQATATAGTLIHTADATALDEIWLYAVNSDTTAHKLTIEFGGVSSPDDLIEVTVPAESGYMCVVPGLVLTNSLVVRAFAATTNVVMIAGYCHRIS